MASVTVSVAGASAAPVVKGRVAPSDILQGQLFAHAAGSSVLITQTQPLRHVCTFRGSSPAANVTALKWAPLSNGRHVTTADSRLKLAVGDADGQVLVWDTLAPIPCANLADCAPAQQMIREHARSAASLASTTPLSSSDSSSNNTSAATSSSAPAAGPTAAAAGSVTSLAWVAATPSPLLAILMAPGLLLLWDALGTGNLLYSCDLLSAAAAASSGPAGAPGPSDTFLHMAVDPWQPQRLCCCSTAGHVLVGSLDSSSITHNDVDWHHMRVTGSPPSATGAPHTTSTSSLTAPQPTFAASRHQLVLLLPRDLIVVDLELGTLLSSTPLHTSVSRAPFSQLAGVYGRGACLGLGDEGGWDSIVAAHADGQLSIWVRRERELRLKFAGKVRLVPLPIRGAGPPQSTLAAIQGVLAEALPSWLPGAPAPGAGLSSSTAAGAAGSKAGPAGAASLTTEGMEQLTARLKRAWLPAGEVTSQGRGSSAAAAAAAGALAAAAKAASQGPAGSSACLHLTAVTSDGRLWQWQLQLPCRPLRGPSAAPLHAPSTPPAAAAAEARARGGPGGGAHDHQQQWPPEPCLPQLQGALSGLPGRISSLAWCSRPLVLLQRGGSSAVGSRPAQQQQQQRVADAGFGGAPGGAAAGSPSSAEGSPRLPPPPTASAAAGGASPLEAGSTTVLPGQQVLLAAAGTSTGHVLLLSSDRGQVGPCALQLRRSLLVHPGEVVRSVKWLGHSPWLVSYSSSKVPGRGVRNSLVVTDVLTGHSYPVRHHVTADLLPLAAIRVSASGAYLLLLFQATEQKKQPAELWSLPMVLQQVGAQQGGAAAADSAQQGPPRDTADTDADGAPAAGPDGAGSGQQQQAGEARLAWLNEVAPPRRLRLVDLPFTALEWVTTDLLAPQQQQLGTQQQDACVYWLDNGVAVEAGGLGGAREDAGGAEGSGEAAAGGGQVQQAAGEPLERLVFSHADGRSGVLTVSGRKVQDAHPTRPTSGPGPHELLGTAVAAAGPLVFLGDEEGQLLAWDTTSGRCSKLSTGHGLIRRILVTGCGGNTPAASAALSSPNAISTAAAKRGGLGGGWGGGLSASPPTGSSSPGGQQGGNAGTIWMRLAVLFDKGAVGVYDVDGLGRLRPSSAQPGAISSCTGGVVDLGWVPTPLAVGMGTLLSVVDQEGSLLLVDVATPVANSSSSSSSSVVGRQATAAGGKRGTPAAAAAAAVLLRRQLLAKRLRESSWGLLPAELLHHHHHQQQQQLGSSPSSGDQQQQQQQEGEGLALPGPRTWVQAQVAAAPAAQCGLLMHPLPQQLLRVLLLLGLSTTALQQLAAAAGPADREVVDELAQLLPPRGDAPEGQPAPAAAANQDGQDHQQQQQQEGGGGGTSPASGLEGLVQLLRQAAQARGSSSSLLQPQELHHYSRALASGCVAARMAAAAEVAGTAAEARFWALLPASLKVVKELQAVIAAAAAAAVAQKAAVAAAAAAPPGSQAQTRSNSSSIGGLEGGQQVGRKGPSADGTTTPTAAAMDATAAAFAAATAGPASFPPPSSEGDPLSYSEDTEGLDADDYERLVQEAIGQAPGGGGGGGNRPRGAGEQKRPKRAAVPGHVKATGAGGSRLPGALAAAGSAGPRLWGPAAAAQESQERLALHETLPRTLPGGEVGGSNGPPGTTTSISSLVGGLAGVLSPQDLFTELRLLEYVVLGDYAAAVALLLAVPPEGSTSWYRSVVCALSLAAAASLTGGGLGPGGNGTPGGVPQPSAAALHLQAAKVVSAHAVGVGDTLLGVHLNCSAGCHAEAAAVLQEAGLWRQAAVLAARRLGGTDAAVVLSRWAGAVAAGDAGGDGLWRAVGLWTAAGCLATAAGVLLDVGMPDAAHAYVCACQQAGLLLGPGAELPAAAGGGAAGAARGTVVGAPAAGGRLPTPAASGAVAAGGWSWAGGWGLPPGADPTPAAAAGAAPTTPGTAAGGGGGGGGPAEAEGVQPGRRVSSSGRGILQGEAAAAWQLFDMLGHRSSGGNSSSSSALGGAGAGGGRLGGRGLGANTAEGGEGDQGQSLLQRVHKAFAAYVRQLVAAGAAAQ